MFSIHDEIQLKTLLTEAGEKSFRYAQIENAIYKNFITNYDDISTISNKSKELLRENCFFTSLLVESQVTSDSGQTTKILFKTTDGLFIEAVIMRHLSGRNTLCVSSQAGCPMGCSFCATGKLGLQRNLEFYEIVDQIMEAVLILHREGKNLRNIVYMGMGEPFLNYPNVKKSIEIACKQTKFDFSSRRVTISTCGIISGIKQFGHDFPQTSLAISLHAPNDELRSKIMPVNITYPLSFLMKALDDYTALTNKRIFYEYIMIGGINDSLENARELAKLLEGKLAHVNFIPYNPGEGVNSSGYSAASKKRIQEFQQILEKVGIPSTIRHTMGDDIDAACGQLALKKS
ncbi:23S rRNA (adenine(2503)-C(2))-methyltransferase RlmN [Candidatus Gracilibacteria bacterium]|nr:23S rRNA (adenine(2503)-C(2))-methyltransferase RlmN [Candidatus Gracilibacteria bacterium]